MVIFFFPNVDILVIFFTFQFKKNGKLIRHFFPFFSKKIYSTLLHFLSQSVQVFLVL